MYSTRGALVRWYTNGSVLVRVYIKVGEVRMHTEVGALMGVHTTGGASLRVSTEGGSSSLCRPMIVRSTLAVMP